MGRLPVRSGDVLTREAAATAAQAVKEIDEHLGYGFRVTGEGEVIVQIVLRAPLTNHSKKPSL